MFINFIILLNIMKRELVLEKEDYEILNPILDIQAKFKTDGWKPEYAQVIKQCVSNLNKVLEEVNKEVIYRNENKIMINYSFTEFYASIYQVFTQAKDESFLELLVSEVPELVEIIPKANNLWDEIKLNCKIIPLSGPRVPDFIFQPEELSNGTYEGIPIEEIVKNSRDIGEYLKEFAKEHSDVLK